MLFVILTGVTRHGINTLISSTFDTINEFLLEIASCWESLYIVNLSALFYLGSGYFAINGILPLETI